MANIDSVMADITSVMANIESLMAIIERPMANIEPRMAKIETPMANIERLMAKITSRYGENYSGMAKIVWGRSRTAENTLEGMHGGLAHYGDGCFFAKAFASLCLIP